MSMCISLRGMVHNVFASWLIWFLVTKKKRVSCFDLIASCKVYGIPSRTIRLVWLQLFWVKLDGPGGLGVCDPG